MNTKQQDKGLSANDEMPRKNMLEAIRDALDIKMADDDNVVIFGEDVGYFGGVFALPKACRKNMVNHEFLIRLSASSGLLVLLLVWQLTD